jgi:hypothetical protein
LRTVGRAARIAARCCSESGLIASRTVTPDTRVGLGSNHSYTMVGRFLAECGVDLGHPFLDTHLIRA